MEAVLFMGIQATGKSTFYKERFFTTHIRINLDMLRTRHREQVIFQACLEAKQPFVIDNTNPTPSDRARYIQPATEAGFQIVGYYFQSIARESIPRNAQRLASEQVPEAAIWRTAGRLELPTYDEGFANLYYVRIDPPGSFMVEVWNDEI